MRPGRFHSRETLKDPLKSKLLAVLFLVASLTAGARGKEAIIEKQNPAMGYTQFEPRDKPKVKLHARNDSARGLGTLMLKLDSFEYQVYPIILQTLNGKKKTLAIVVDLTGPLGGGFTFAPVTFSVDGEVVSEGNREWQAYRLLGGHNKVTTNIPTTEEMMRTLAKAKEVYVTVIAGAYQYSAQLSDAQLATFRLMVDKYDALAENLRPETDAPSSTPVIEMAAPPATVQALIVQRLLGSGKATVVRQNEQSLTIRATVANGEEWEFDFTFGKRLDGGTRLTGVPHRFAGERRLAPTRKDLEDMQNILVLIQQAALEEH